MAGNFPCRRLGDNCSCNVSVLTTCGLSLKSKASMSQTFCFSERAAARLPSWVGVWDAGWVQLGDESSCYSTEAGRRSRPLPSAAPRRCPWENQSPVGALSELRVSLER